ncbi:MULTISPECIES: ATP-binding protein [unclassified Nodularia (in: cyanobacteria)]|uniref:ATP-binding protein n=1 Tax=unclassified Nodularia (in: cyanobacteria) TaxID=2656917 RepID=UPI001882CCFD|nr:MULTISPECIES: ATP-binding protein [unclassified Nodularia (in: cyanobacteria)]MBE9198051.1 PAS domain-containing protein [Nodularia sp. LEGE 06071]MCC2691643.1 PAS domain-containing protein [Nodularia sp. LEGE 04288]
MEFFNQVSTSKNQENLQPDLQVFLRHILDKISDNIYINKEQELEIFLQQISEKLEQEIQARTALLNSRVDQLKQEINEYKQAEAAKQETEQSFRRHNTALQKLVQSESLQYDDFPTAIKYVTEVASLGLDVDRVSVWLYTEDYTKIQCADLYERPSNSHSSAWELSVCDYPSYFQALKEEQVIAVVDVHQDTRTSEFSANYTLPLGITSMLDVRIWSRGKVIGVVCCEHLGTQRQWTLEEENFISSITEFVRLVIESSDRKSVEAALAISKNQFRLVVEQTGQLIYIYDLAESQIHWAGAIEEITGYTADQWQTFDLATWEAHIHPDDRPRVMFILASAIQNKSQYQIEYRLQKKDGYYIYVEDRGKFLVNQITGTSCIAGTMSNVSDRKTAEKALRQSEVQFRQQAQTLKKALGELQRTQSQMIQSEKMSSLGQLVAGVAHEINNPVNFIYGNISPANDYIQDLLKLISLYQEHYLQPMPIIQEEIERIDLAFLIQDLPKLLSSMKMGAERIRQIVLSLRNFSRLDEAEYKAVDIHEGIDSSLLILKSRLKDKPGYPAIEVIKEYGNLPLVECYAGQLNQVFINILTNAIDVLEERDEKRSSQKIKSSPSIIRISTKMLDEHQIMIKISDNGMGIPEKIKQLIFNPFFTTKPIGKGTGMGMSISYQIITKNHGGKFYCISSSGQGTEFVIEIPLKQQAKLEKPEI